MADNAAHLELIVDGVSYRDIKQASITRAIDELADSVDIEMSDLWIEQRPSLAFPFEEGDEFEFRVDGEIWLQGIVTELENGYSKDGVTVSMRGMSWAVNLTTACVLKPRRWTDAPLDRIVRDIVKAYGLEVSVDPTVDIGEPFKRFAAGVGETAFECIRRAVSKRGLLVVSDIESNLVITKAGPERMNHTIVGARVPGRRINVLSASRSARLLDRHDEIIVVGQSGERSDWTDDQASHGIASAHDWGIDIFRPLVIHEPSESSRKKLQARADWEVRTRAGKARTYQCTVQGYLAEEELPGPRDWYPNRRIHVIDGLCDIDEELLIEHVNVQFDATSGTTTTLYLVAPETYDPLAPPTKKKTKKPRGRKGRFVAYG